MVSPVEAFDKNVIGDPLPCPTWRGFRWHLLIHPQTPIVFPLLEEQSTIIFDNGFGFVQSFEDGQMVLEANPVLHALKSDGLGSTAFCTRDSF